MHVVTPHGELDAFTAPRLGEQLDDLIQHDRATRVVVDLTDVTFLDSTALGTLVGAVRQAREQGGTLRIVTPTSPAARIFELTGLDRALELHATLAEALTDA